MKKEERINQIISEMKAGTKESYLRNGEIDEQLNELLLLQEEAVKTTFNGAHTDYGNLRIYDVRKHLAQLNLDRGNIAEEELIVFEKDAKDLENEIKKIKSGKWGENSVFRSLKMLRCNNRIVKNIALQFEDVQGELDAVVFTEKAIFLLEVKNAKSGILIDEKGNYLHLGADGNIFEHQHDRNFAVKMNEKEYLLRKVLESNGFENLEIHCLLVFTNTNVNIENRYEHIQHCFLSDMLPIIQNTADPIRYTNNEMDRMVVCLNAAAQENRFPFPLDAAAFKLHFATLMAKLEGYEDESDELDSEIIEFEKEELAEDVDEQPIIEQKEEEAKSVSRVNEDRNPAPKYPETKSLMAFLSSAAIVISGAIGFVAGLKLRK